MRLARRPLPIEIHWAIRFALAMLFVAALTTFVHYELMVRRIRSDTLLVIRLQAQEIAESFRRQPAGGDLVGALSAYVDQHIASSDPDLDLGIRVVDADGRPVIARGSFERLRFPSPQPPGSGEGELRELDLGAANPYVMWTTRLPRGFVEIAIDSRRFARGLRELGQSFLLPLPVLAALTALLGWWLARRSLAPVARIAEAARRITASQLDEELPISGSGDELDRLAQTLNAMIARLRKSFLRTRAFSSNAAHQLRSPVSVLRSRLENAQATPRDPHLDDEMIAAAIRDVDRIGATIQGMLHLADSEGGLPAEHRRLLDPASLVAGVIEFFEPLATDLGITIDWKAEAAAPPVNGDRDWLSELFSNLLDNAIRHTPRGGSVQVALSVRDGSVAVAIRDAGPGIPAEELPRIFERFHRGRGASARGAGLGLPIAREIAEAHGGRLEVESTEGRGSCFTTWLPAEPVPPQAVRLS